MHGLGRKLRERILELLEYHPAVALLGPRQLWQDNADPLQLNLVAGAVAGICARFRCAVEFYCKCSTAVHFALFFPFQQHLRNTTLRDDYLKGAQEVITDPMILVNVISRRAKQLKSGYKPLIESLERLSAEDMALREVMEGKITYQLAEPEEE